MDDKFVDAYDRATGVKHRIPAHWLDHPILSKPFRKTPKQRASERPTESATPATDTHTVSDLDSTTASRTASTTETPAAGAKE